MPSARTCATSWTLSTNKAGEVPSSPLSAEPVCSHLVTGGAPWFWNGALMSIVIRPSLCLNCSRERPRRSFGRFRLWSFLGSARQHGSGDRFQQRSLLEWFGQISFHACLPCLFAKSRVVTARHQ